MVMQNTKYRVHTINEIYCLKIEINKLKNEISELKKDMLSIKNIQNVMIENEMKKTNNCQ